VIYDDALENGWQNWSWAEVNLANSNPVHGGSLSISVTASNSPSNWQALYLDVPAMDLSGYTNLTFWINGGSAGGQQVQVQAQLGNSPQTAVQIGPLPADTWRQINLSTAALGVAGQPNFTGFWIQAEGNSPVPTFYVDEIRLQSGPPAPPATNANVTVQIDAAASRHAISPMIYGVAFGSSNQLADLNFTMNRSGGNAETRYNWQLNAHNHGADWYFESIDDGDATPGASADDFVANSRNGGAQPMITISMIGWMPKLGASRAKLASYSIAKYGPQTGNDWQWYPDAGNGVGTNSADQTWWLMTTNDPNDANFPTNSLFQQGFVQHLTSRWGTSTNGGIRFYLMDNEHTLWFSTHRDVHPVGPTMQEIRDKFFDYAGMVKSNDPNALVCAPEEWGWTGYFYSGYDQQNPGQHDRAANGGWDYMPWLLDQFRQRSAATGQRLLDYFTLHCYPQGGESGNDVSPSIELLRNRSTRQLWDTNYVDQSWIGQQPTNNILMLIPRMKNWVATNYPGTKIGITEYNWGAEPYLNGATAQADLLGIFGRENLDLATRWTTPTNTSPVYQAMKLYRNYDGNKSTFGDLSVSAVAPDPDNLSAFAAVRTNDGALTVVVINKNLTNATPTTLSLTNFVATGPAQVWQLASTAGINRLTDAGLTNGILNELLPPQSVTLFVVPGLASFQMRVGTYAAPGRLTLWLDGQSGQKYVLQSSTDLAVWSSISTNLLSSNSFSFPVGVTNSVPTFYRGLWRSP